MFIFVLSIDDTLSIEFTAQPQAADEDETLDPVVISVIKDAVVDTTYTDQVTLVIANDLGGTVVLSGTTVVSAVLGVATFSDLSINVAGVHQLIASINETDDLLSDPFTISTP